MSTLRGRVFNWKFTSALEHIDEARSEDTKKIIEALSVVFGNEGWEEGLMAVIVSAAVTHIYDLEGWSGDG
jgi:hypothetical protein